jgi:hypothetical protein
MNTPYNTGKVKIGIAYQPPTPRNDRDMDRVQSALTPPSPRLIETHRQELRSYLFDALLWTASLLMACAVIEAPAIHSFIQSL